MGLLSEENRTGIEKNVRSSMDSEVYVQKYAKNSGLYIGLYSTIGSRKHKF